MKMQRIHNNGREACRSARRFGARAFGSCAALALAAGAAAQPTFSIDWQGPPVGGIGAMPFPRPITEADILMATFPMGAPLLGPAPALPVVVISGGPAPSLLPPLMLPAFPGALGHPAWVMGGVEVDALSYGSDFPVGPLTPAANVLWVFSVDEYAAGVPGSMVAIEAGPAGPATDVSADIFGAGGVGPGPVCAAVFGLNVLITDGNGMGPPTAGVAGLALLEPSFAAPGPMNGGSNLDALDVDTPVPGPIPMGVYFSLDSAFPDPLDGVPNSASALINGLGSGANVAVSAPLGAIPVIYALAPMLGLDLAGAGTDDIDALVISENGDGVFTPPAAPYSWAGGATDMIFFSVRRGSAVIGAPSSGPVGCAGVPIEPGDILVPGFPTPGIWIPAEALGLATVRSGFAGSDDLDALDLVFDCNANGQPDNLEIVMGAAPDCNGNGVPDGCDIASGVSRDANGNGLPDECESGSCCTGAACAITLAAACPAASVYTTGGVCALPATTCCRGDFDRDGVKDISDIFKFLAAWFAGAAVADWDADGANNIGDIFAFLAEWFVAC